VLMGDIAGNPLVYNVW